MRWCYEGWNGGFMCVCVWFLGTLLIGWWATAAVGTDCWLAICHQEKCVYWCAPCSWVLSSLRREETRWEGRSEWERERRINMQMSHGIMTGLDFELLFAWLVWEETGRFGVCEILESCLRHTHHLTVFDNYIDAGYCIDVLFMTVIYIRRFFWKTHWNGFLLKQWWRWPPLY